MCGDDIPIEQPGLQGKKRIFVMAKFGPTFFSNPKLKLVLANFIQFW